MTSREQFEAYVALPGDNRLKWDNGKYSNDVTEVLWEVWQASREAIEVAIPAAAHEEGSDYWFDDTFQPLRYERDVEKEIKRHGLKVKP